MIGALLSNTPANLLRSSGVAGVSEPGTGEIAPGREQLASRDSLASSRAATVRAGSAPPLTPEAVIALQDSQSSRNVASGSGNTAQGQSGEEEADENLSGRAAANGAAQNPATAANGGQTTTGQGEDDDADGDGLTEAEEKQVQELKERDREVRAHEQAHARVGGAYASAPTYTFQQGPDGKRYAIGGEVQIDTAKERTPEATIRKMQIVIRAATAPAEPSSQDLKVAQQARSQLAEAQAELRQQKADELRGEDDDAISSSVAGDEAGAPEGNRPPGESDTEGDSSGRDRQSETAAAISAYQSAAERGADTQSLIDSLVG
ncbi:putative metalloprotease CJM1_0395 family protein [Roseibium sp.]|uniref:putative metalloprotease CJM1_0395 family protein n=1 Tax=Roseibium sp. TaxID=1936156 RepID=UPI003BB018B6